MRFKSYAMTGWQVGYTAAPAATWLKEAKSTILVTSGASSISQAAAIAALTDLKTSSFQSKSFQEHRDLVVSMINQSDGLNCPTPWSICIYPSCKGCKKHQR